MTKTAPEKEIVAVHELRVSVEPNGIQIAQYKYPMTFTGKNYIPQFITKELHLKGFNSGYSGRVPKDEIMVLRKGTFTGDRTTHVDRHIYYMDGQEADALIKIRNDINETITRMKKQMDDLHDAWVTRKERPLRKVDSSKNEE